MTGTAEVVGVSREVTLLIVAFLAIAAYNVVELTFWIFDFFKRRAGLYFWSLLIATLGLGLFVVFNILRGFRLTSFLASSIGMILAYVVLVTGQILVLYSRLHLITNGRILRFVLTMIIVSSLTFVTPFLVLWIGDSAGAKNFTHPERIYERISITGSCLREFVVCGIYIYEAIRHIKPILLTKGREGRRVIINLILVNVIVITLDSSLLAMEYINRRDLKFSYSAITHSVKLKMEFGILNKLIGLVKSPMSLYEPADGHALGVLNHSSPSDYNSSREKHGKGANNHARVGSEGSHDPFERDDSHCTPPGRTVCWDHVIHGSADPDAILPASDDRV